MIPLTNKEYVNHKPNFVCPFCHTENTMPSPNVTFQGESIEQEAECTTCGKLWVNIYELTGWEPL